jgi:type IV secretory pathway VirB4 component
MAKKSTRPATQRHLPISAIREGVVIMKDGTLRGIIAVSSINFALKSDEEQHAVISQYVQFLNVLQFPIQIVIHSRELDIGPYLEGLAEREKTQTNDLLKVQMADYRKFVSELVTLGEIMTKSFYVVVPYSPFSDSSKSFFSRVGEAMKPAQLVKLKEEKFQERREELLQRVEYVQGSLNSIGLRSVLLETQSLIELFYQLYNPLTSSNEHVPKLQDLVVEA